MIIFIHVIIIALIIWGIFTRSHESLIKIHLLPSVLLRLSAGIILGVVYFYHYGAGDTLVFDTAARGIINSNDFQVTEYLHFLIKGPSSTLIKSFPVLNEPRSTFLIKIISLFYLTTDSNYWLTGFYFSLLSFIGSWKLVSSIIKYNPGMKWPALVGLMYTPAFVFWTSGVLKESIAWFCIALAVGFYLDFFNNRLISIGRSIITLILIYILWQLKYYYAAVLVLSLGPLWLYHFLQIKIRISLDYKIFLIGSIIVTGTILALIHPNFSPARIFPLISENHEMMLERSAQGHAIRFFRLVHPGLEFIINIPVSLMGGLFMPLAWQGIGVFARITGFFNTLLLVFFFVKLVALYKYGYRSISASGISLALYIIILAVLLAYTSPNFGTLERYKTSYIAFFTIWILYENPLLQRILIYFKH